MVSVETAVSIGWLIMCDQTEDFRALVSEKQLDVPPGKLVLSYSAKSPSTSCPGQSNFELYAATPLEMRQQFNNMQMLPLWLIDGASHTDVEDTRWQIYTVYEKWRAARADSQAQYAVAGFMTVFSFSTPFRGDGGKVLRICQALVLPPFQKQGHGKRMMQQVRGHNLSTRCCTTCMRAAFVAQTKAEVSLPVPFRCIELQARMPVCMRLRWRTPLLGSAPSEIGWISSAV